eukprot:CAMPEP_0118982756 /NCGR_PEP_ID=MMETSP1173-20130426/33643_1 /TAXON_ID=1034831 /ORGANISM="Rhizochromulina marina cf, Strain CCMP1243" /LENGTH=75 /DNA_ID=CAMNT_0006933277 /DNA_START=66 /DNA_END=290 /DNA_ORIENTATION=+
METVRESREDVALIPRVPEGKVASEVVPLLLEGHDVYLDAELVVHVRVELAVGHVGLEKAVDDGIVTHDHELEAG